MSTIEYAPLDDPNDLNYGVYAPSFMFGRGLVRDGSSTTYVLTGANQISLQFNGEALEYNGKGRPTDGHVTSCRIFIGEELQATITDIDIKASKLAGLDSAKEFYDLLGKMDITGSAGDDLMTGWRHDDTLQGGDGQDQLIGGAGDDRLFGGDGNDIFGIDSGKDVADGGAGLDLVAVAFGGKTDVEIDLRDTGFQKVGGGETIKLISIEGAYGGNGDDKLTGDAQANALSGNYGDDTLIGGAGDDTIYGGLGDDVLKGGAGEDTLGFGSSNDHGVTVSLANHGVQKIGEGRDKIVGFENIRGTYYDDKLTGDDGFNHIEGGNGDDTINGGGGQDGLFGDSGDDVFLFKGKIVGVANIADFNDYGDHDLIDLSGVDANIDLKGDQDFTFIGTSAFTGVAGQLRWSHFGNDPSRDILVSGDTNGDGVADFNIQLTSPVASLTIGDFDL